MMPVHPTRKPASPAALASTPSAPSKPARRPPRRMILFALALVLLLQEALLRLLFPLPEIPGFNRTLYVDADDAPNPPRMYERVQVCSDPDRACVLMHLGEYGFRTPPFRRDPRGPRVLFLGDSFTEGMLVPEGASFPDRIRAALDGRAEVLNLGVSGVNIPGLEKLVRDAVPLLRPTHVVFTLYANDFYLSSPGPFEISTRPPPPISPWEPRAVGLIRLVMQGSPMRSWIWQPVSPFYAAVPSPYNPLTTQRPHPGVDPRIADAARRGRFNPTMVLVAASGRDHLELTRPEAENVFNAIARISAFVASHGARFTLAFIPEHINVSTRYAEAQRRVGMREWDLDYTTINHMQQVLKIIRRELRLEVIDLTPALRAADLGPEPCYYAHDSHLAPRGHQIVADTLLKQVFSEQPTSAPAP